MVGGATKKGEFSRGSAALEADALATGPTRRSDLGELGLVGLSLDHYCTAFLLGY